MTLREFLYSRRSDDTRRVYGQEMRLWCDDPDRFEKGTLLLEALFELLFDHLSYCRSWKFADDSELSFTKEKEERVRYSIAVMDRCVDLGLLSKGGF